MEKVRHGNPEGRLSQVIRFDSDTLPQGDHRADGVVLRRKEASPLSGECLMFLRDMGAVWVGAPGPRTRFGGGAEPMTWGTFLLYQSPRRLYLKGVDVAEDFLSVHGSRRSLLCAAKWHKELAAWLPMWHENNALLSLFWRSMKNLSRGLRPSLLDVRFAWRWGNIWGVAPSFETCPGCGSPLDGDDELPRSAEGFFCRSCHVRLLAESRRETTFYEPIRSVAFKLIKSASSLSAENFARAEPDMRSLFSADETLEGDVRGAASWIYSFLKVF